MVETEGEVVAAVFVIVLYPMVMFTIGAIVKWCVSCADLVSLFCVVVLLVGFLFSVFMCLFVL